MASPPTRQDVGIAYFITPYQSVEQLLRLMKILRRAQPGADCCSSRRISNALRLFSLRWDARYSRHDERLPDHLGRH
jgi:hypothetical protein